MNWKVSRAIRDVGGLVGLGMMLGGFYAPKPLGSWLIGIGAVGGILAQLQALCFAVCPHCGWPIGKGGFKKFCSKCGKPL